jgi:hypothetical protein
VIITVVHHAKRDVHFFTSYDAICESDLKNVEAWQVEKVVMSRSPPQRTGPLVRNEHQKNHVIDDDIVMIMELAK